MSGIGARVSIPCSAAESVCKQGVSLTAISSLFVGSIVDSNIQIIQLVCWKLLKLGCAEQVTDRPLSDTSELGEWSAESAC